MITVENLIREFEVPVREPGMRGAFVSLVKKRSRVIVAVNNLSLNVSAGQVLGVLGPNGSGKTTTLKCIAGLLMPTSGNITVMGLNPSLRPTEFLRRLGFVMGQRSQLHMDLPVRESFELSKAIYRLSPTEFARNSARMVDLLDIGGILDQPARKLSLGQRMRCEFAHALLHQPSVVLLDEPTLGLDFDGQQQIRTFVREYVAVSGACVLLTSHYLADIEALCVNVIAIAQGQMKFTGTLTELQAVAGDVSVVRARTNKRVAVVELPKLGTLVALSETEVILEIATGHTGALVTALEALPETMQVTVSEAPLEDSLRKVYRSQATDQDGRS